MPSIGELVCRARAERKQSLKDKLAAFMGAAHGALCEYEPRMKELRLDALSDREAEVLSLYGRGLSTVEVADLLGLSRKTIETYRENIKRKLALGNGNDFLRFAVLLDVSVNVQLEPAV